MQLEIQTDMFSDMPIGRRFWDVFSDNPADGRWVCVTDGDTIPGPLAVQSELGFMPTTISEMSPQQALRYAPPAALQVGEYTRRKKGRKRD